MAGFGEALFEMSVGGVDVTERFNPILEHLEVEDRSGEETAIARIILADAYGQILMPGIGDTMSVMLGWVTTGIAQVFNGTVTDVRSRGGRGQGRLLAITAHGFDTQGKAKEPQEFHKDKASLQDFMSEAAGNAGLSFQAEGSISSVMRDYWAAGTESFIHLGQRIAREVGASFKIDGTQAMMWPMNSMLQAVGGGDGSVTAVWGDGSGSGNLLEWDIAPILARPRFNQARVRFFDHLTATWKEQKKGISGNSSAAEHTHRQNRADQDEATNTADANGQTSEREAGSGQVVILGNNAARPDGTCNVANVRPGVDGTYRIDGVRHELNRTTGFHTHLELKQPQGGAGSDTRPAVPDTGAGSGFIDSVPTPAPAGQGGIGHA
jgi:phage protein D